VADFLLEFFADVADMTGLDVTESYDGTESDAADSFTRDLEEVHADALREQLVEPFDEKD
jgi:hypothetical protein